MVVKRGLSEGRPWSWDQKEEGRQPCKCHREEGPELEAPRQERSGHVRGAERRQVWPQDSEREGEGHTVRLERQVGQILSGSCRPQKDVWILFWEQWGTTERIHPGIVWYGVCLKKIVLAADWRFPWRKVRVPTGRPFRKPSRSPDQEARWPGEMVPLESSLEGDSGTTSPSQGAWMSECSTQHSKSAPLLTSHCGSGREAA